MGVLPGILGTIQAAEVIKLIVGGAKPLVGRLVVFDAWAMRFNELQIEKDPNCPICGANPTITELIDYEQFCGMGREENEKVPTISAQELKERFDSGNSFSIIDIREPHERALYPFPSAKAVPFGQLVRRMGEFNPSEDLIFICKVGLRSIFAIRALKEAGYQGPMYNLTDGVAAWATLTGAPPVGY
jgi:adenylyltransferase/sulfurtransferase